MPKEDEKGKETLEAGVEAEELEKALDNALEGLTKAKKKLPQELDEEEAGEEEEEEEETEQPVRKKVAKSKRVAKEPDEPDFEALSKSLGEAVEEEEETSDILDAVPFVKALVDALDEQITDLIKAIVFLSDKVDGVEGKLEKSSKIEVAQAKLVKSMSETMRKVGETTRPIKSNLGRNFKVMRKSETGEETEITLSKADALDKLTTLHQAGKLELGEVVVLEEKIQKGLQLPNRYTKLLSEN